MEYAKISELLALYGESDFLLFDLMELADSCNAKKVHLIYDKRDHPKQSLLQQNLGMLETVSLSIYFNDTPSALKSMSQLFLNPDVSIH
jgi:sacsin